MTEGARVASKGGLPMFRRVVVAALLVSCSLMLTAAASAKGKPGGGGGGGGGSTPTGYDVSYPQCGATLPSNPLFGIVGVNDGIVYSPNPCLASEIAWAQTSGKDALLYANTANPGPALSSHWPTGQTTPQVCDGSDSSGCAFDYGYNAAADSYQDAVAAYSSLNLSIPANSWWLDVESANSWETNTANNVAALQGEVSFFHSQGLQVGIYANANDWGTITGNTTVFNTLNSWHASATRSTATAQSYCGQNGITGGPIQLSQYRTGTLDGDIKCF
jgi:hypothetical protein